MAVGLCRQWPLLLLALLSTVLITESSDAGVTKLNAALPPGGDVWSDGLQFSPDGSRVLYLADQDTDEVFEVYSVPSMSGVPVKLNAALTLFGDVSQYGLQFSPDGSRVLYLADQDRNEVRELYSVPAAVGAPAKLNAAMTRNGDVSQYGLQLSPGGSRVIYHADQDTDRVFEIYSVPAAGGAPVKLNAALTLFGDVSYQGLQFSPDGSRVLYRADQDRNEVRELYSVPAVGGVPVKLNAALPPGGDVSSDGLQFSPDGSRVLYRADQDTEEVWEIYSVPAVGGVPVKLNAELTPGGYVSQYGLQFSPDGSRVLYLADQDTDEVFEIYSVPSTISAPAKLNAALTPGGDVSQYGLQFSPDGSRVLYLADQDTDEVFEIYSVPSTSGVPVKLNAALTLFGDVSQYGLQFSPDGSRVLYLADQDTDNVDEIYSVPSTGGVPVKLNAALTPGGDVSSEGLQFIPDGSRVLYHADQDTDGVFEIYTRVVSQKWNVASGQWDGSANWDQGEVPDEVMSINVNSVSFATVTGPSDDTIIFSLDIGATDTGVATLALQPSVTLTVLNQTRISERGALTGSGHFHAQGGLVNNGRVELDRMTVVAKTIQNSGVIFFDTSDVHGDINNQSGAVIAVKGNSKVTFWGDLTNNGTVEVSAGSTAVHFGTLTGEGGFTGSGTNLVEGNLSPGSSPGTMSFSGDVVLGASSTTQIELAGTSAQASVEFDQVEVTNEISGNGALAIQLIEGFEPLHGDDFQILTFGSRTVSFGDVQGIDLRPDLVLAPSWGTHDLTLRATVPGDASFDRMVDITDFAILAGSFGDSLPLFEGWPLADFDLNGVVDITDFGILAGHFGEAFPMSAGASQTAEVTVNTVIPEPATITPVVLGILMVTRHRRSRSALADSC